LRSAVFVIVTRTTGKYDKRNYDSEEYPQQEEEEGRKGHQISDFCCDVYLPPYIEISLNVSGRDPRPLRIRSPRKICPG